MIASTPEIDALLSADCPVAIGVSGGKDSSAVAFATVEHLDRIGHAGARVLVHSDLGVAEWRASKPMCETLADRLGLELIVVRRAKGDMMDRWEQRWRDNVARYAALECVQLILPWSTPAMRFCTSELKTSVICQELTRRFPGQTIVSVTGIRRQESSGRKKAPVTKCQPKLTSKTRGTNGVDWHPIIDWSLDEVLDSLRERNFPLHEAYTTYGASRVSCAFCIMSAEGDLAAAALCADNHSLYRRMVRLESRSTFAFQSGKWLADVAPHLLTADEINDSKLARERAEERTSAEARIPRDLLYVKGWPTCIPTRTSAELLAGVRSTVSQTVGIDIAYRMPAEIRDRYEELFQRKNAV